jgi:hypothetical protein
MVCGVLPREGGRPARHPLCYKGVDTESTPISPGASRFRRGRGFVLLWRPARHPLCYKGVDTESTPLTPSAGARFDSVVMRKAPSISPGASRFRRGRGFVLLWRPARHPLCYKGMDTESTPLTPSAGARFVSVVMRIAPSISLGASGVFGPANCLRRILRDFEPGRAIFSVGDSGGVSWKTPGISLPLRRVGFDLLG